MEKQINQLMMQQINEKLLGQEYTERTKKLENQSQRRKKSASKITVLTIQLVLLV